MSDSVTVWATVLQAPSSMGFSCQEFWSGSPCPPPRDLCNPGTQLVSLSLLFGRWVPLQLETPGKLCLLPQLSLNVTSQGKVFPMALCKWISPFSSSREIRRPIVTGLLSFCNTFCLLFLAVTFNTYVLLVFYHYNVLIVSWGQELVLFCLPQAYLRHWIFAE